MILDTGSGLSLKNRTVKKLLYVLKPGGIIATISLTLGKGDYHGVKMAWAWSEYNVAEEVNGFDYFDCLVQIRETFEKDGYKILCNGARYDVYPSQMSRQMGKGLKAYKLTIGKQATEKDLVDIFDPTDAARIGTVEQQKKYYDDWIKSLG